MAARIANRTAPRLARGKAGRGAPAPNPQAAMDKAAAADAKGAAPGAPAGAPPGAPATAPPKTGGVGSFVKDHKGLALASLGVGVAALWVEMNGGIGSLLSSLGGSGTTSGGSSGSSVGGGGVGGPGPAGAAGATGARGLPGAKGKTGARGKNAPTPRKKAPPQHRHKNSPPQHRHKTTHPTGRSRAVAGRIHSGLSFGLVNHALSRHTKSGTGGRAPQQVGGGVRGGKGFGRRGLGSSHGAPPPRAASHRITPAQRTARARGQMRK